MSFDTTQIHAFAAVLFAIASILVMPLKAMAMSKTPDGVSTQSSDSADGPACELPPLLEIDDKGTNLPLDDLPPIDRETKGGLQTATFAMG